MTLPEPMSLSIDGNSNGTENFEAQVESSSFLQQVLQTLEDPTLDA